MTILMSGINYLDMKEVAEKLKKKSVDAAARWCLTNNIAIMTLGNKRVVSEFEFNLSFEQPLIEMLKRKHGDGWATYYEVYQNNDVIKYFNTASSRPFDTHKTKRFDADSFLNDLGYGKSKNS